MKKIIRLVNGTGTINQQLDTILDGENVKTIKEWDFNEANEKAAIAELAKCENNYRRERHNHRPWIEADEYALVYVEIDDDNENEVDYTLAKSAKTNLFVVKSKNGEIIEEDENCMNLMLDDADDADEIFSWCLTANAGDVFQAEDFSVEVVSVDFWSNNK